MTDGQGGSKRENILYIQQSKILFVVLEIGLHAVPEHIWSAGLPEEGVARRHPDAVPELNQVQPRPLS